jgi:ABC-type polysaccharide/polyol phosphate export permease
LLANLKQLFRYRALISSLVARELKARYRGSVLGFFWSFVNPLLLLVIYTVVFTVVLPGVHPPELEPYAVFMFCGILPWTWFSSSLLESSNVLVAGGNLIKKVLFPAEVLPIVTVLGHANGSSVVAAHRRHTARAHGGAGPAGLRADRSFS